MIQLIDVSKRFGPQLLFEGLSWHIRRGERIGLVGANGAGKTTLLRILGGMGEPDGGTRALTKGVRVGLLDQEPDFRGERTVLQEVEQATGELREISEEMRRLEEKLDGADEALMTQYGDVCDRFESLGGYHAQNEAKRVLCGLGFTAEELHDPASRFSGGWRMRIALARLLLTAPDVLLLDEPSNHLDLESLTWLENQLRNYEGAIVTISHDRWFLDRTVKMIADLRQDGVRTYVGGYEAFVNQRDQELELLEKQKKQQDSEIAKTSRFIERFRAKNTKATAVQSRVKALEKVERIRLPKRIRAMRGFKFPQPKRSGRFVAELENVRKSYADNVVYTNLSVAIERGWKVALVGVNGAGKSTLLKILASATDIDSGVSKLGHNVEVGYFAQHQLEALDTQASVLTEMSKNTSIETHAMVRSILGAFLFSGDDVEKPVGVLSGGEKARLALAKMLINPVALLLMDEPTSHLDLASRDSLEDALRRYEGTVVVVSHDRYFMNAICSHVLEVDRGQVRWYPGNYDEYLWKKKQEAEKGEQLPEKATASRRQVVEVTDDKEDRKARKRREAEARQRLHNATKTIKPKLEAIQEKIEAAESRMADIDEMLADPIFYQENATRVSELLSERSRLEDKLSNYYEQWEELESELESATQAVQGDVT